jgi:SOUL heme-binding protein
VGNGSRTKPFANDNLWATLPANEGAIFRQRMKIFMKIALVSLALTAFAGLISAGCAAVRAGYDSAPYRVVRRDGKFELRNYPALVLVETPMHGSDDSFMRLFRFIGGNNAAKQKISMTTPVFMSGETTNATMAFVMPKNMSASATPKPNEPAVSVRENSGGQFAVLRFSGRRNGKNEAKALAELQAWLARENLKSEGGPIYGYFDPPWTPSFFRRNEVMLRLAATP